MQIKQLLMGIIIFCLSFSVIAGKLSDNFYDNTNFLSSLSNADQQIVFQTIQALRQAEKIGLYRGVIYLTENLPTPLTEDAELVLIDTFNLNASTKYGSILVVVDTTQFEVQIIATGTFYKAMQQQEIRNLVQYMEGYFKTAKVIELQQLSEFFAGISAGVTAREQAIEQ